MTNEEAIKILEEEAEFLYGDDEPYNRIDVIEERNEVIE